MKETIKFVSNYASIVCLWANNEFSFIIDKLSAINSVFMIKIDSNCTGIRSHDSRLCETGLKTCRLHCQRLFCDELKILIRTCSNITGQYLNTLFESYWDN